MYPLHPSSYSAWPPPPVCVRLSVFQVFPVHDQVQLRSSAHTGAAHPAQRQRGVASRSVPTNRGTEHIQRPAGAAACPGAGGSLFDVEVKGHVSSIINEKYSFSMSTGIFFNKKLHCRILFCPPVQLVLLMVLSDLVC